MSTPRVNRAAPIARSLVRSGIFAAEPFLLADVGASGGIADHWRVFEPYLSAVGFDPLVRECERLNREEGTPAVRYYDYFVGSEDYAGLFPSAIASDPDQGWSNQPFERTSAARGQRQAQAPFAQSFNDGNPDIVYTNRRTSLDEFFRERQDHVVDFIKVDTDGHDYEVLRGATEITTQHQVLGFFVECQFHGITHPHSNLFANIDRLLREQGFSLFDVEVYRYTRGLLPGHFVYSLAGQTLEGQVLASDALYLRDVAAPRYEDKWGVVLGPRKLAKLACLFEIYGMPDCAAELLVAKERELAKLFDVKSMLDTLAREVQPRARGFDDLNRRFDASINAFYPGSVEDRLRRNPPNPVRKLLSRLRRRLKA